jgi:hypothetical protein
VAQGKLAGMPNVVAVFVGDKNRVNLAGLQPCLRQPGIKHFKAQTAVNQQAFNAVAGEQAIPGLNNGGVARTAAAKALET